MVSLFKVFYPLIFSFISLKFKIIFVECVCVVIGGLVAEEPITWAPETELRWLRLAASASTP